MDGALKMKNKPELTCITLESSSVIDFSFHIEGAEIVIDTCRGISPQDGLSLFSPWMLEAAK